MGLLDAINILKGYLPPPLDIIFSLNIFVMIMALGYAIYDKIRKLNAIRTLIIYKDFTNEIKDIIPSESKLKIKKGWEPRYDIQAIIPAKKTMKDKLKFWGFKQKNIVIAIEDLSQVISLRNIQGKNIREKVKNMPDDIKSQLLNQWTKDEVQIWLKKVLSKAQADRKLFSDQQFYIFVALLFGNLILLIMVAQRMGIL